MGTVQLEIVAKSDGPNNRIEAFLEPQSEFLSTRLWIYLSTSIKLPLTYKHSISNRLSD